MSNLLDVLIGALIGLGGVMAGTWLQGRKEHQRWLRDQKLRAAIDYIGATGDLHDLYRKPSRDTDPATRRAVWGRAQDGRSALHLLCDDGTVEAAEALIVRIMQIQSASDDDTQSDEEAVAFLRDLVLRLRAELGVSSGWAPVEV